MNLIAKKTKSGGRSSIDCVSIGESTISINGTSKRILNHYGETSGSIGFNDDNNLCLYIYHGKHPELFKISTKGRGNGAYISLNSKETRKRLQSYIGQYDISVINNIQNGIKEVVLVKR